MQLGFVILVECQNGLANNSNTNQMDDNESEKIDKDSKGNPGPFEDGNGFTSNEWAPLWSVMI
jgi:hypothetical protein